MIAPSVRELTIDPGPEFTFVPGQWVSLRVPPSEGVESLARAYSIASAPRADGQFEVAVTRVESGPGSAFLHEVQPGSEIPMTHAQGFFTLGPLVRPIVLVATGTGVSPFRAMLQALDLASAETPEMALILGVRVEDDLLYRADFESIAAANAKFRFEPTLSRPAATWRGRSGYVQKHVPELVRALGGDCDVYVCGLSRMVKDVRAVLKEQLAFTRDHIHTERYD